MDDSIARRLREPDNPILGDWDVTYGSRAVVTVTRAPTGYTFTARTAFKVTGGRCYLPAGTVVGSVARSGGRQYTGWHGLWWVDSCAFSNWTAITLTLDGKGKRLRGVIREISETVTYRRR